MKNVSLRLNQILLFILFCSLNQTYAATFQVTNTNDSGAGSLRQAILDANANPGADTINITASGTVIIPVNQSMGITEEVLINGNPNYNLAIPSGIIMQVYANNVTLDGLKFEDDTNTFNNADAIISNGYNQLVVKNCYFKSVKTGINVSNCEDILIHGNTFEGSGWSGACLTAGNITESTTTNRSLDFYNNTFIGGVDGITLNNVENITFNATGTTGIVLDIADGYKSLWGILLEVSNMDNLVIDGFDFGYDDGSNNSSGRCMNAVNCNNLTFQNNTSNNRREGFYFTYCDTVLIHNNTLTRTDPNGGTPSAEGISVAFGTNATITDNSLSAMGQQTGRYALALNDISQDTNGDRVDVRDNTFSACTDVISISNMDDIEIDETLTGTTEVHLPNTDGRKSCFGINLNLTSCDNVTLENLDLGYDDPSQNTFGRALNVTGCDNMIVQNNTTNNRRDNFYFSYCDTLLIQNNTITRTGTNGGQPSTEGISVAYGSNVSILNNSLTSMGQSTNRFALILNDIGFDVNNNRLDVQGNTFASCGNAVSINNMDDLEIDETYVPGVTEVHLPNTDGRLSCYGINLRLYNTRNLIIENFDLGYTTAGNPLGRALDVNNCDNMVCQNNTSDNRFEGFYFTWCDTLTIDNNTADHSSGSGVARSGINVANGSNATVTNNVITQQGQQSGQYAISLDNIQFDVNSDRIDYHSNTFSNCANGIRLANMSDLEVHETASGTTEVHLPNTDGRQGSTGINAHFIYCDNLIFDGFDLSFTGAATYQGTGLYTQTCNNLSVTNTTVDNRYIGLNIFNSTIATVNNNSLSDIFGKGILVQNGANATVKNNMFTNAGLQNESNASMNLISIADDGTSRLDVTGNTFNGGNYGFFIQGMNNLNVSETYVSGTTEIHMPSNTGMNTLQSRVYFNDCDDLSLSNFNFVKDGAQSVGYGIRVNSSINVTLDNFIVTKYNIASIFFNNTDLTIQNSEFSTGIGGLHFDGTQFGLTLTNNVLDGFNGTGENNAAIRINAVGTSGVTSDFLSMSGNKFKNNSNGLIVKNTDNMTVSDESLPGTHITVVPSDSIYTSINPMQFLFGDNLTVENISIKEKPGAYRSGSGIYLSRSTNSSFNNVSVSGRGSGLHIRDEDGITISNCLIEDNTNGIYSRGFNNTTILNIAANNNNFSCNGNAVYADVNSVVDAANNYWGASDGSSSDSGSGDTYFESPTLNNEGFVNNTTTFLTNEDPSSPIGGRKIFNASTAQLTDGQTTTSTADSTDYGMVDIGMMKTRQFRIVNASTDTLFITSVTSTNGQFTIANAPTFVLCGDSTSFDVIYTPTNENMETSTIDIVADDCYGTDFEFNVAGQGFQPCDITINSVTPTNETCDGANDGVLTVNASCVSCTNGTSDIRYSIDGSDFSNTTGVFTGLADGTYTVTIRDVNDEPCTDTSTGIVVAAGAGACCDIAITSATPTDENCPGADDGQIDVVATCTTCTSIEYSIDDFATMNTTGDFTGLVDGTYTVKIRDSGDNSCAAEMMNVVVGAGSDTEDPTFGFTDTTTIQLYLEDFESPIVTPVSQTNPISPTGFYDIDASPVATLFGANYSQTFTVETVLFNGTDNQYSDPSGTGGDYSLGIWNGQDDLVGISFDIQNKPFINIKFDAAGIELFSADPGANSNGTWNFTELATPEFQITIYDDPNQNFDINNLPAFTVLAQEDLTGVSPSSGAFTAIWANLIAGLDVSGSINGNVVLVFDLTSATNSYAALDNIDIQASDISVTGEPPADIALQCLSDLPAVPEVDGIDNCDMDVDVTYVQNPASPTGNDQTITRTWTLTDDATNTAMHVQTITIDDTEAPVAVCPANTATVILDINGNGTLAANSLGDGSSTDNCGSVTETNPMMSYTCANLGANTVVMTADDGNGNTDTENCTVMVVDQLAPTFDCNGVNIYNLGINATCDSVFVPNLEFENFQESDNCDGAPTFSQSPLAGSIAAGSAGGSLTVTVTFTDASGNSDNCNILFPIADLNGPAISVQDVTVSAVNGVGTITPAMVDNGSSDNCSDAGNLTLSLSETTFNCDDEADCYQVTTVAGMKDVTGFQDGTGTAASFNRPRVFDLDANGDLIILAQHNHAIRKMTMAGVVTTIAGDGTSGYQDGTGSGAKFANPTGLAIDANGDYFVAEWTNATIRKVSPAGVVTTFVGTAGVYGSADGTGPAAQFATLRGMDFDSNGDLYVADFGNHNIRKITPAGVVTTFAGQTGVSGHQDGTGAGAIFNAPQDLVIDENDNIYVIEFSGNTIRKITPAGVVTTLAGNPGVNGFADGNGVNGEFSAPSGIAYANGLLYVADQGNQSIRSVSLTGDVKTISGKKGISDSVDGGSGASFKAPFGIAADANSGEIFVGDLIGHVVRKLEVVPDCFSTLFTVADESGNESQCLSHITLIDCCDIEVTSVTPTDEGCPDADDGSITIDANCESCACDCDYTPVAGTWNGTIDQTGFSSYSASLVISCGATNTSSYPDFPCNAELVFNSKVGNTFIFDEIVTSGAGCVNGIVHLTPSGVDLFYEWYSIDSSSYASGIITGTPDVCLEYSLDGTNWQAENVFSDLPDGTYTAHVRDVIDIACTDSSSGHVINAGTDNEAPVITCPVNVTVQVDAGTCEATNVALGLATATDNCNMSITPTNDGLVAYPIGVTMVTWTADDGNGQSTTCIQTVTVEDNEAPVITCPINVTVNADVGACEATNVSLGLATATDNCNMSITPTNDGLTAYPKGVTNVTWTANDGNGQSVTCIQTVTVITPTYYYDTDNDGFGDPGNSTTDCPQPAGTVTDNTDCDDTDADEFPGQTWYIDADNDGYGVSMTTACERPTGGKLMSELNPNSNGTDDCDDTNAAVNYDAIEDPNNGIDDNCNGAIDEVPTVTWVELASGTNTGSCTSSTDCCTQTFCFGLEYTPGSTGTLTSYTTGFLTDCNGTDNSIVSNASCVMDDNSMELIDCGNGGVLMNSSGVNGALAITVNTPIIIHQICVTVLDEETKTFMEDAVTDISMAVDLTVGPVITEYPEFDDIMVTGNQAPVLMAGTIDACYANNGDAEAAAIAATTGMDDCTGVVTYTAATVGSCSAVVTVTGHDACGLTSTVTYNTKVDGNNPVVNGAPNPAFIQGCSTDDAPSALTTVADLELLPGGVQIMDDCTADMDLDVSHVDNVGTGCPIVITRVYTITDECSNEATFNHVIIINDANAPVITGDIDDITIDVCGGASAAPAAVTTVMALEMLDGNLMIEDACGADTDLVVTHSDVVSGTCPVLINRTYTIADDCDNLSTVTQMIQVNPPDNIMESGGPVATVATMQSVMYETPPPILPVIVDGCNNVLTPAPAVIGGTYMDGDCMGTITYTYTYEDCVGRTFDWVYTNEIDCGNLNIKLNLEGVFDGTEMSTSMQELHLLPGMDKNESGVTAIIIAAPFTPFGQPYQGAPWNYTGNLGDSYGEATSPNAPAVVNPYPDHVVDWVLVSVRENTREASGTIFTCAGWLHSNGDVTFPEACPDVMTIDDLNEYYLVVEHRNHLPVLQTAAIMNTNEYLEVDFTESDSYAPVFRYGQKEIMPGVWAMYNANIEQITSRISINSADQTGWKLEQGNYGYYNGDVDMSGNTNSADETEWKINQNITSGVKF